jgi:hydrogenase expression/formation protein HypD
VRFIDEYRQRETVSYWADALAAITTQPWTLMEVCGGQTNAIVRHGLDQLLPDQINLVHGPGCPVCVTPVALIDAAVALAQRDEVTLCSFGDMLRVPGSDRDLQTVQAGGGDVRVVVSPLDAVDIAIAQPQRQVVLFAVGFETTAPANALAIERAHRLGLDNFSVVVSHVLVPPALQAVLNCDDNRVQGFLAAGHVCTVMGLAAYEPIASRYRVPIVATGFEPVDILHGVYLCVEQLERGEATVANQYRRCVRAAGNGTAQELMNRIFTIIDREWRGLGTIADSGFGLRPPYDRYDALARFALPALGRSHCAACRSGDVLRGALRPDACPSFAGACTPEHPLGPTMVSAEGACAAYYLHRRQDAS